MPYDENIPIELQLLRLGSDIDGTAIARYSIEGDYWPRYCIMDALDDVDTMDISGAIEETLHSILDNGGTQDDVRRIMGLVPESEIDPDTLESGEYTSIDLGLCLDGALLSFNELVSSEIDPHDALSDQQIENIQTAFNNLEPEHRLPASKLMSQHSFTGWQAYQVCKAFESGLDSDTIDLIANPELNHAQMRELRLIAERTPFADPHGSPYNYDIFKTLATGEMDAGKLHVARNLMQFADFGGIPFDREWLHLDPEQARALAYAIRDDVPIDALEGYASGKYPAHLMEAIRMALNEGAEQQDIARLLNPALSEEQAWNFCSVICSGRFSPEQLDVLCDPSKPADYIHAMRSGFVYGLDTATVLRYADGRFLPEQMDAIYIAAGDESLTPEMLDVIADPSLDPDSMTALKVSFQQGATIADVQHEKQDMQGSIKEDAVKSSTLHDVARESRDASARLGSDNRESKAAEREELE